ncbi:MAG: EI24 domain-containing protein [Hydrogenophaga sp.]
MSLLLDAAWRALAYCLHPRVVVLSFLPLVLMLALAFVFGYWLWDPALQALSSGLQSADLLQALLNWLTVLGLGDLRTAFAPLLLVVLITPVVVVLCLLLVSLFMTPAMVSLVVERRFPSLLRLRGASWWSSLWWSLGATALALLVLALTLPLWWVPPFVLVLPPLIWGWLTYRVFAFDALADHATEEERRAILNRHRWPLWGMGVVTGYLGAAPSVLWASGSLFVVFAPVLLPLAIWIYTWVLAFSSLWFAHYTLALLATKRMARSAAESSEVF